ncbi:MAG: citryl-CoA lyase [Gammaproteobacteria bacterium]|nr:citryl-CoA lyase [Gammaproteobacteria bacterium]
METWTTGITQTAKNSIRIGGYDIAELMTSTSYTETVFLLHTGRLPDDAERRLLNAVLVAVSDHGPGSPSAATSRLVASANRSAPEAAVAAGVLAIGDAHAGAGLACMQLIEAGLAMVRDDGLSITAAARKTVTAARGRGERLPGIGHRVHTADPRTAVLFSLARDSGVAGDGVAFVVAIEAAVAELIKPMPANLDGALAAVLFDLGFPPLFAKLVFIIGRVAGLSAHVMEEYTRERAMRIRIPVSYDGPPPRDLNPT